MFHLELLAQYYPSMSGVTFIKSLKITILFSFLKKDTHTFSFQVSNFLCECDSAFTVAADLMWHEPFVSVPNIGNSAGLHPCTCFALCGHQLDYRSHGWQARGVCQRLPIHWSHLCR